MFDFKETGDWTLAVRGNGKAEHVAAATKADDAASGAPKWAGRTAVQGHKYALLRNARVRRFAGREVEVIVRVAATQKVRLVVAKDAAAREGVQQLAACDGTAGAVKLLKGRFVASSDTCHVALVVPAGDESHVLRLGRMVVAVAKAQPECSSGAEADVFTAEQPAAPVAAKVGCAKKRAAETGAPAVEGKDTIPAVHRTAPAEEVEEVNTDGKAASIKPCRVKAQDGKLRFGVCDDGETHLFPVLPKRGWKPLPGVASNQHSGSRTAVCRAFPRFARFEGRELELSLPVHGTGAVALMAGKDLNEAEGLQAAKELGRVVVKGEDAVLEVAARVEGWQQLAIVCGTWEWWSSDGSGHGVWV